MGREIELFSPHPFQKRESSETKWGPEVAEGSRGQGPSAAGTQVLHKPGEDGLFYPYQGRLIDWN